MTPDGSRTFRWTAAHATRLFALTAGVIIVVWLLWFPAVLLFGLNGGPDAGRFGDPFGILSAAFSGIAFAVIAIGLLLQHHELIEQIRRDRRERIEGAQELARIFYDETFFKVREEAQATRVRWFKGELDRRAFAAHWVDGDDATPGDGDAAGLPATQPTSRLIDYYTVLLHKIDAAPEEAKPELGQMLAGRYLWPYWRGYLLDLAATVSTLYDERIPVSSVQAAQYPLVAWVKDLKKLDGLSGLPPYRQANHPIDGKYPGAAAASP